LAVRIYALAKELNYDSKAMVEVCAQAGITGKGSALASLTDEEVDAVKAFVRGGGKSATTGGVATASKPSARPAPLSPRAAPPEPTTVRREDYIPPAGAAGKPRVLDQKPSKPADESRKSPPSGEPPAKSTPAVRFAAVPAASKPPSEVKPALDEPAPQKPDLKLPADVLRPTKTGAKPLAAHMKKAEERLERQRQTEPPKPSRGRSAGPAGGETPVEAAPGSGRSRDRHKKPTVAGKDDNFDATLGGRAQRQLKRKRLDARGRTGDEANRPRRSARSRFRRTGTNTAAPRKTKATLSLPCTVRSFCEASGIPVPEVLRQLMAMEVGGMPSITMTLDRDTAELLAEELGIEIELKLQRTAEDEMLEALESQEDDPESLVPRPPVITFLGHVDHGKTSLLDRIIGIDVVSGESGGITQHIRAYEIDKDGRQIAFVDTPGHEAFTEMRARGANVTDIAVLVVAADDGIMPQTEEAISHARAAEVPIVVALNKIDLPSANVERVLQQLAANELLPTEWGGDVEVIRTSATTGEGIDNLLETLLTIAELHDYKANPDRPATGTCLEAQQESGRGVVSKLIVQKGTLRVGDCIVCGSAWGRVKAMYDTLDLNRTVSEAGPSTPVNLTGLSEPPGAGQHFYVVDDVSGAREIAESRQYQARQHTLGGATSQHVTLENLFERLGSTDEVATLGLILRADVRGSIEAIQKELGKLDNPEVKIKILQATVGGISAADVHLADASDAIIIGFNVVPDEAARQLADQTGVQIRRYDIIYKMTEDIRAAMEGMLKPEQREKELGRALVQRVFTISRVGTVAGCRVMSGTIERQARIRVIRNNTIIGDYPLDTLRREKDDTREVREGMECGIKLAGFNDVKELDVLEAYKIEEVARTLSDTHG